MDNPESLEPAYLKEPSLRLFADYINELSALNSRISRKATGVGRWGMLAVLKDEALARAIADERKEAAQTGKKFRTIWERYFDPDSPQAFVVAGDEVAHRAEINASPLTIKRTNELAEILNTTTSLTEFKRAFNEMFMIVTRAKAERPPLPFVSTESAPDEIPEVTPA